MSEYVPAKAERDKEYAARGLCGHKTKAGDPCGTLAHLCPHHGDEDVSVIETLREKYRPEFCRHVMEWGTEGLALVEMAARLGTTSDTLSAWRKNHAEFDEAMKRAREASLCWWMRRGRDGVHLSHQKFNARQYEFMAKAMFPDDFKDQRDINVRGSVLHLTPDMIRRLPDDLVDRIAEGEDAQAVLASAAADVLERLEAGDDDAEEADYEVVE